MISVPSGICCWAQNRPYCPKVTLSKCDQYTSLFWSRETLMHTTSGLQCKTMIPYTCKWTSHYKAEYVLHLHSLWGLKRITCTWDNELWTHVYWLLSGCLLQRGSQFHNNSWKFVKVVKLKTWKNFRVSSGCAEGIVKNNDFGVQWAHGSLKALEKEPFRSHGFWQMESKYQTFRTLK